MDGTVKGDRASVGPRGNDAPGASETKTNPVLSNWTWSPITSPPGRLNVHAVARLGLTSATLPQILRYAVRVAAHSCRHPGVLGWTADPPALDLR